MVTDTRSILINTKGNADTHDITDKTQSLVKDSGIRNGIVTIFSPSSTSALTTIEYESGALNDLRRLFDEIINPNRPYAHNARWGDGNGHSHVRASLLGPSITVPIVDSRLTLGTWQQIILVDFDIRPRKRELIVQILGE